MKKMLMIINPNAGKAQIKSSLVDIMDIFIKAGYRVEVHITQCSGDATRVVKSRGAHVHRVVCSGGDGTLDETINGIMALPPEKRPELGYISAGTTNDFAHSMKLPSQMLEAADVAVQGDPFSVDIGRLGDTYFCYLVGFGAFTDVSYATPQDLKKVLGHPAYLMEAAKQLPDLKSCRVRVKAGDVEYDGDFLCGFVSNSYRVAGITGIWGTDIELDDGLFEVTLVRLPSDIIGWGEALTAVLNPEISSDQVIRFKTDRVSFLSEEPIDWVRDGEFGGTYTEVEVENIRQSLTIIRTNSTKNAGESEKDGVILEKN